MHRPVRNEPLPNRSDHVVFAELRTGSVSVNFDAKVRREGFEPIDFFCAQIGSVDAFAGGLKVVENIIENGAINNTVESRFSSWGSDRGKKIKTGKATFAVLESLLQQKSEAAATASGRRELLEHNVNRYIGNV